MYDLEIRKLRGIGLHLSQKLQRLKIMTLRELFYYFPLRYEDRRKISSIGELKEDDIALIKGKVLARNLKPLRGSRFCLYKKGIFEAIVSDGKNNILCTWFNQPYLKNVIKVGDQLLIFGKVKRYKGKLHFICPEYEKIDCTDSFNMGRIVGVYALTQGITQKMMRKIIFQNLKKYAKDIEDPLPFYIRDEKKLPNIHRSLYGMHFPSTFEEADISRQRFIFEELFFSQILVYLRKAKRVLKKGITFKIDSSFIQEIKNRLSFQLTLSQENVISEIFTDMQKPHPMHRLLQGDVGSGKTIVAIFAMGVCVNNGYQASLMVPTEVLAYQHYHTIRNILFPFGYRVEILTSLVSKKSRTKILKDLKEGRIDILVGTHSLLVEDVVFKRLGLVVIDEQHKFGVAQRVLLPKKGENPDCLVMSATPIPRTLALSLYGDLDISVIKEKPKGRKQPDTILVEEKKRGWVYNFIRERVKEGRQVYIVYPLIEGSEEEDFLSLTYMYEILKKEFSQFRLGMLHGRLKKIEKEKVIEEFLQNKINILVTTTVIEVGINIENANTMIVENPERFGLAQLHQLRGRIQRAHYKPYFILIVKENVSENAKRRFQILKETNDGFRIAEEDLKLRGPGDFFGFRQSGFPQLRIANPIRDMEILKEARLYAYRTIKEDPHLLKPYHRVIREHLCFWFKR